MKTLQNHREKMSIRVRVRMSKIIDTSIKLDACTYATYMLIKYSFAVIRATFLKPPNANKNINNFIDFRS